MMTSWCEEKFYALINEYEKKWEQINKKTAGVLPEKLWNYIYHNNIIGTLKNEFPYIAEFCDKVDACNADGIKDLIWNDLTSNYKTAAFDDCNDFIGFKVKG